MILKPIGLNEKKLIERYLKKTHFSSGAYSFAYIYIWKSFFKFSYLKENNCLCVFAKDGNGMFMYFAPLTKRITKKAIDKCFAVMSRYNKNDSLSRIENIPEEYLGSFVKFGYRSYPTFNDYVYKRVDLVNLCGNRFKHKRSTVNYFIRNNKFQFINYKSFYYGQCIELYKEWQDERAAKYSDEVYRDMLKQSFSAFCVALANYKKLGLEIRLVIVDNKVKSCTVGNALDKETFCIMFEIADLNFKGLAQFIFMAFCKQMNKFNYINTMDDSGLANLAQVKLSYRPFKITKIFNIVK